MDNSCEFTHNLASKGTPNLYLAANFLEPDEKFHAFLAAYAAMRLVDDLVDDNRGKEHLEGRRKNEIISELDHFAEMFRSHEFDDSLPYSNDIKLALVRFDIPDWPFTLLAEAMKFDLENDRFDTIRQFLRYSEGAAVAPGAIFMHLAATTFDERGQLISPRFDIREAARPLAVFSYFVHILRDFKKDFTAQKRPLIYIDLETSDMFHVSEFEMAETAHSGRQSLKFTKMVKWLFNRLTEFQSRAEEMLAGISRHLPDDGRFALNFIYHLYSKTAANISKNNYNISAVDLNLGQEDIFEAARLAAATAGREISEIGSRLEMVLAAASPSTR